MNVSELNDNQLFELEEWLNDEHNVTPVHTEPFIESVNTAEFWSPEGKPVEPRYNPALELYLTQLWTAADPHGCSRPFYDDMLAAAGFVLENRMHPQVVKEWLLAYLGAHVVQLAIAHQLDKAFAAAAPGTVTVAQVEGHAMQVYGQTDWGFGEWLLGEFLPFHLCHFKGILQRMRAVAEAGRGNPDALLYKLAKGGQQ